MDDPLPLGERIRPPLMNSRTSRDREPVDSSAEKVLNWQQDRIQRKLKDEYDSSVFILAELIRANSQASMHINQVRVLGDPQTRPALLDWIMKPLFFESSKDSSTLEDVIVTTKKLANKLIETDNYVNVLPSIEKAQNILAGPDAVDLVFYTRPRGRYFLKSSSEVGNQDGSVTIQARARNALGIADTLEAAFSSGLKTRLAGNITLSAPVSASLKTRAELTLFGLQKDLASFSSCIEGIRGLRAAIRSQGRWTTSEFAYDASLRHIHALTKDASLSIRNVAGHTFKSAISHSWTYDSRENKTMPSQGCHLRLYHELAGLGGDATFLKANHTFQLSRSSFLGSTLSLSGRAGCLYSLDGHLPPFNDRFQLGGPLDVRMFKQNGLGPHDGHDSLGGNTFWAGGMSLVSNIPRRPEWPVKTHVFLNAGRLDNHDRNKSLMENVRILISQPCASVGIGLLYHFGPARVELNFGVPLAAQRSDEYRRGFQVGLGLEFL